MRQMQYNFIALWAGHPSAVRRGSGVTRRGRRELATCSSFAPAPTTALFSKKNPRPPRSKRRAFSRSLPLGRLNDEPPEDPAFPFVLSAGERRSFTANTIIRDPDWRKRDAEGALRINPDDAATLGVATGERVRLVTNPPRSRCRSRSQRRCSAGISCCRTAWGLPTGKAEAPELPPTISTAAGDRDPFVGTPWHKHLPARLERI
jgi:anaerobic selenocysteine-containing dehydrogenase